MRVKTLLFDSLFGVISGLCFALIVFIQHHLFATMPTKGLLIKDWKFDLSNLERHHSKFLLSLFLAFLVVVGCDDQRTVSAH